MCLHFERIREANTMRAIEAPWISSNLEMPWRSLPEARQLLYYYPQLGTAIEITYKTKFFVFGQNVEEQPKERLDYRISAQSTQDMTLIYSHPYARHCFTTTSVFSGLKSAVVWIDEPRFYLDFDMICMTVNSVRHWKLFIFSNYRFLALEGSNHR